MGVEVLAISTDSRFSHKIWQEEELAKMVPNGVPYPMLSDGGGRVGTIYGVYDEDAGVDIRGRFIIDPDFVIRAMEVLTPEVGRNVQEGAAQLRNGAVDRVQCHPGDLSALQRQARLVCADERALRDEADAVYECVARHRSRSNSKIETQDSKTPPSF